MTTQDATAERREWIVSGMDCGSCAAKVRGAVERLPGVTHVNIATMQLYRDRRGGLAVMVMECDDPLPDGLRDELAAMDGVVRCTCLELEEG